MTDPSAAWEPRPSTRSRLAAGRAARRVVARSSLSRLSPRPGRDPLGILAEQNATRVPELVPLRTERMSQSPFAFFRGTAALMAADLGGDPGSGILVASCGDAHVANFGFYGSPQRTIVFDLNDFDEAAWAPWEWDVKRLVTSIVIAGDATSRDEGVVRDAALRAVRAYARGIAAGAAQTPLARYFSHLDIRGSIDDLDPASRKALRRAIRDAERRTGTRAVRRLTEVDATGRVVFVEAPPATTHTAPEVEQRLAEFVDDYADSANVDIRILMRSYVPSDSVRRVVGVGSVGTRCYLVALQGGDGDALILQAKEANESVLVQYGGIAQPPEASAFIERHGQGARVVALQRILQAFSDPFLGYLRAEGVDLYVRQFHDMKGGLDIEALDDLPFARYAESCAATLARAHAQSPNAATVAGYIGSGRVVGEALLEWAYAYARVSRADYDAFVRAGSRSSAAHVEETGAARDGDGTSAPGYSGSTRKVSSRSCRNGSKTSTFSNAMPPGIACSLIQYV